MNSLSKQDVQIELRNAVNSITSRTLTKQDFANAVQSICSHTCEKQDMMTMVERAKETIAGRVIGAVHDQQALVRQLADNLEAINRRLNNIEQSVASAQATIRTVQDETEIVMSRTKLNPLFARNMQRTATSA